MYMSSRIQDNIPDCCTMLLLMYIMRILQGYVNNLTQFTYAPNSYIWFGNLHTVPEIYTVSKLKYLDPIQKYMNYLPNTM